ncbi:MAG: FHA domain-containing protein [Propionibacteriaceae bacterium]|nr:FHA domain-containing protein [Propionibacteriaceae bacterium]
MNDRTKICPHCSTVVDADFNFCTACGQVVPAAPPPPPVPVDVVNTPAQEEPLSESDQPVELDQPADSDHPVVADSMDTPEPMGEPEPPNPPQPPEVIEPITSVPETSAASLMEEDSRTPEVEMVGPPPSPPPAEQPPETAPLMQITPPPQQVMPTEPVPSAPTIAAVPTSKPVLPEETAANRPMITPPPPPPSSATAQPTTPPMITGVPSVVSQAVAAPEPVPPAVAPEADAQDVPSPIVAGSVELVFDQGERIRVTGPGLIGRNPQSKDSSLTCTGISDTSISKNHLEYGLDDEGLWVKDRGSTNGSKLVRGAKKTPLKARKRTHVNVGDAVLIGSCRFVIEEVEDL